MMDKPARPVEKAKKRPRRRLLNAAAVLATTAAVAVAIEPKLPHYVGD